MHALFRIAGVESWNQNLNCLSGVENWIDEHPATVKILKIAGLILGIGLLASVPLAIPLGIGIASSLAVAGITAIVAASILFACWCPPALPNADVPQEAPVKGSQEAPADVPQEAPVVMSIEELWGTLERETDRSIAFCSRESLNHRYNNVYCPLKTAVRIKEKYLHANQVGRDISERSFVASQAPMPEDFGLFWGAVFEKGCAIVDLTTNEDLQVVAKATKYYPDEVGKSMRYGTVLVTLEKIAGSTYTYAVVEDVNGAVKSIKRYHYDDWKDFEEVGLQVLVGLVKQVEILAPNSQDLVWVHCSAGLGRTGSLITALVLKEKIKNREIDKTNLDASLINIIIGLRRQRGPGFVNQLVQLNLLREYATRLINQDPYLNS